MNRDIIEGRWKQFRGKLKAQLEKLSDENLDAIFARRPEVAGKLREGYGVVKDGAGKQVERFADRNTA